MAMPHARLGEGVCAYVILRSATDATAADFAEHVQRSGLARQKCPERFEFPVALPRTASGKVSRTFCGPAGTSLRAAVARKPGWLWLTRWTAKPGSVAQA